MLNAYTSHIKLLGQIPCFSHEDEKAKQLLANWTDPRGIDSPFQDMRDVAQSTCSFFASIIKTIGAKFNHRTQLPGDGAILAAVSTLSASEEGRKLFREVIRLMANHIQLIYSEYRTLSQPTQTSNFVKTGTDPLAVGNEMNSLRLCIPPECPAEDREDLQEKLDAFTHLLQRRGFVAYKDNLLILNPKTHFAVAMVYDETTGKICLHIRDTASDSFWERGSAANWLADVQQGVGLMPDVYADGDMFAHCCAEIFGAENLQITGYSMGGGIAIFSGIRNRVPATAFNPAFVSPCHTRFFPEGWEAWAQKNIQVLSVDNDILSRRLDDPETGGILPSKIFPGIPVFLTEAAKSETGMFSGLRNGIRAHYLSTLLFGLLNTAMQDEQLREYVLQILGELPPGAQKAYFRMHPEFVVGLLGMASTVKPFEVGRST
jgi:hypothetical protein